MIDARVQKIIDFIKKTGVASSKEVYDNVDISVSYATLKRILSKLITENFKTPFSSLLRNNNHFR